MIVKPEVGMILRDNKNAWEVLEYNGTDRMKIKVLEACPHTATYVRVGGEYPVEKHESEYGGQVWEIPGDDMDRDSSQMLLFLWNDGGVGIELDF